MSRRFRWPVLGLALMVSIPLLFANRGVQRSLLAQDDPTATPNINWVYVAAGVNVRSGPGLNYSPIGALGVGAWVQPPARGVDGEWGLIAPRATQGWVLRDGVSGRLQTDALPVIEDEEPAPVPRPLYYTAPGGPTYPPNATWVSVGADGAYVRSGPGQGYVP